MELLDYQTDSSRESESDEPCVDQKVLPVVIPSFIAYLENYIMNQRNSFSCYLFILCEVSEASRLKLRAEIARAMKTINGIITSLGMGYDRDNILDQMSDSGSMLGTDNNLMSKKLHISLFPTLRGQKHRILEFDNNFARCLYLLESPYLLLMKRLVILDELLGGVRRPRRISFELEPQLKVLSLYSTNRLYLCSLIKPIPSAMEYLKSLSALIQDQALILDLDFDWFNIGGDVCAKSVEDFLYHVTFVNYQAKKPSCNVGESNVVAMRKEIEIELKALEGLTVESESMVLLHSPENYKTLPLMKPSN